MESATNYQITTRKRSRLKWVSNKVLGVDLNELIWKYGSKLEKTLLNIDIKKVDRAGIEWAIKQRMAINRNCRI